MAIFGPTSSGKTALSLEVCEAASEHGLRPVVLNADSRQVYAGMDIGTSKIKPSQMRGFEHRLLDVAEPSSKLSLEAYAQMARDELASLAAAEDALPVLVGGTGVYVQSVLDGWDLTGTRSAATVRLSATSRAATSRAPTRCSRGSHPRWPGACTPTTTRQSSTPWRDS